jgi:hypothetical protein
LGYLLGVLALAGEDATDSSSTITADDDARRVVLVPVSSVVREGTPWSK